jgi:hypothetical protein
LARRAALHRPAPRRRREDRPPARPQRHRDAAHRKEQGNDDGHPARPAGARRRRSTPGRPANSRSSAGERRAPHQGVVREHVQRGGRAAGVRKSAHGVRKIGATRAAENGATVAELEAIFGWEGGRMASLYTRAADRVRLARGAMSKLAGTPGEQAIPSPDEKVRAGTEIDQSKQGLRK